MSWMIAVIAGIALVSFLPILLPLWLLASMLAACLALALAWPRLWLLFLFVVGIVWGSVYGYGIVDSIIQPELEGQTIWVEGEVIGLPDSYFRRGSIVQSFELQLGQQPVNAAINMKRLRLKWQRSEVIKPGQHWRLYVKLKRPHGMVNPGGFDYQSWLIQRGIGAVGYVRDNPANRLLADRSWTIDRQRWQLATYLDQTLTGIKYLPLFKALLIGDKRAISRQQWDLFANTGTTHLMVISGLHIGLIAGLVFIISRLLIVISLPSLSAERWAALLACISAMIYAAAAGFSLPTQRALLMIAIVMLAIVNHRQFAPQQGLITAAFFCLLLDPLALHTLSFWLSFTAVAWIMYGSTGRLGGYRGNNSARISRWLLAQYLVFIGLLPVLAILLGRVSLLSPLANLPLLPLFSLVLVPFNLLAALLLPFSEQLSLLIWRGLDQLLDLSLTYLQWLTLVINGALLTIPAKPAAVKALALAGVLILLLPRGLPFRLVGLLLLLPLLVYRYPQLEHGDIRLTVIDVGQGLSVLVETQQQRLLYDVGARYGSGFDVASAAVLPLLRHRAVDSIDTLIVSHNDNDHAGGLATVADALPVNMLLVGELTSESRLLERKLPLMPCHRGQRWQWQGVNFEIIHPGKEEDWRNANNRSCVVKISVRGAVFLLTGDIAKKVESNLLALPPVLPQQPWVSPVLTSPRVNTKTSNTVLIAAHHGSLTSSSWPLVKTLKPDYVVFSSGYRNQFGHPNPVVLSRYRSVGSKILTTSNTGAITFEVKAGILQTPVLQRQQQSHYWLP